MKLNKFGVITLIVWPIIFYLIAWIATLFISGPTANLPHFYAFWENAGEYYISLDYSKSQIRLITLEQYEILTLQQRLRNGFYMVGWCLELQVFIASIELNKNFHKRKTENGHKD